MMISTAQIAPLLRPATAAAPLANAGSASDAFAEVLALLTADQTPVAMAAYPERLTIPDRGGDPAQDDACPVPETKGPPPGVRHRHSAHESSSPTSQNPPVGMTAVSALIALPVEESAPPAGDDLSVAPRKIEGDPSVSPPVAVVMPQPIFSGPLLPQEGPRWSMLPSFVGTAAAEVPADPVSAPQASDFPSPTLQPPSLQPPALQELALHTPAIKVPSADPDSGRLARTQTGGAAAPKTGSLGNEKTINPTSKPMTEAGPRALPVGSPLVRDVPLPKASAPVSQQAPVSVHSANQRVAPKGDNTAVEQSLASLVPQSNAPVLPGLASVQSDPDDAKADLAPKDAIAPQQPSRLGPAPPTAPRLASSAQPHGPAKAEGPKPDRDVDPQVIRPARVQAQQAPVLYDWETPAKTAVAQGTLAQTAAIGETLSGSMVQVPDRHLARMPPTAPDPSPRSAPSIATGPTDRPGVESPAPVLVDLSDPSLRLSGAGSMPVPPDVATSARPPEKVSPNDLPQWMPLPRAGGNAALPGAVPQARVLAPFPILTADPAFSRFQSMLDQAAPEGRSPTALTGTDLVSASVAQPPRQPPAPDLNDPLPESATVKTMIPLRAVLDVATAPAEPQPKPAPALAIQVPPSSAISDNPMPEPTAANPTPPVRPLPDRTTAPAAAQTWPIPAAEELPSNPTDRMPELPAAKAMTATLGIAEAARPLAPGIIQPETASPLAPQKERPPRNATPAPVIRQGLVPPSHHSQPNSAAAGSDPERLAPKQVGTTVSGTIQGLNSRPEGQPDQAAKPRLISHPANEPRSIAALPGDKVPARAALPMKVSQTTAQPVTAQTLTEQPMIAQAMTAPLITGQPATEQPMTAQPVTAQPVTEQTVHPPKVPALTVTARSDSAPPDPIPPVIAQPMSAPPVTVLPSTAAPTLAATAAPPAANPDLPELMNLPKLANSEPVRPSRRPILSPEALQGASQASLSGQKRVEPPAPIAAKMHAKGDNQETVARTAAKVAPPDLPPVKLDMAPARPDVTQFGQSSTPIPALLQPHRIAATPSAPHVASPLEHGHNALPKGFSTTLAHSVLDSGHSRAELILEPAELGRLRFDLVTQGDQVQVILAAERPDTLDLLRRHVDELRQEFRNSGLDTGTLSFGQWGKGGDGRALPDQPGLDNVSQNPRPLIPVTLPATRLSAPGSGLDLRL